MGSQDSSSDTGGSEWLFSLLQRATEEADNPEQWWPHTALRKAPTEPHPFSPVLGERHPETFKKQKNRNLLFTPPNPAEENPVPTHTLTSTGQVGNIDFQHY